MNRTLLLSAAAFAVLIRPAMADDLTISSQTTSSVATSTAANSSPGNITIATGGSVAVTEKTVAVTIDSNNSLINNGLISSFSGNVTSAVTVNAGNTGSLLNNGNISVLANGNTSTSEVGVLLTGNGAFHGDFVFGNTSVVTATGPIAQAISLRADLNGNLTNWGTLIGNGTGSNAILSISSITGTFANRGNITVLGGGSSTANINPSSGAGVSLGGSVLGGILNAGPVNSSDTTRVASINAAGTLPALLVAPSIGGDIADLNVGALSSDATNPTYSLINRGLISSIGTQPGVSTVGMQIGNNPGDASFKTNLTGGILNNGTIQAIATSDNKLATSFTSAVSNATAVIIGTSAAMPQFTNTASGNISASTSGPLGGGTIGMLIYSNASLPVLNNAGVISASSTTTDPTVAGISAQAISDGSGSLITINNSGTISATATRIVTSSQITIAANLGSTSVAETVNNSGTIVGDIIYGGSNSNVLTIEGPHASMNGQVRTSTGHVNISVSAAGTGGSLTTSGAIRAGTLTVGAGGTLNLGIGVANGIVATGAATFDANSHLDVTYLQLAPTDANITLVHSDTALVFNNYAATTSAIDIPFLFNGNLTNGPKDLILSLHRKTATQLGLTGSAAIIYEPAMKAAGSDADLGAAFSSLTSSGAVTSSLNQLLPIVNAAPKAIVDNITNSNTSPVAQRQQTLALVPEVEAGTAPWMDASYHRYDDSSAIGFSGHGEGLTAGIDYSDPKQGHFGIAFTIYQGDVDEASQRIASTHSQWFLASPYVGLRMGNFFVNGMLNAGYGRLNNKRTVDIGAIDRDAQSNTTQWVASGGVTGGYVVDLGGLRIVPQVNLNAMDVGYNAYTEQGGGNGVDLTVKKASQTSLRAFAGAAAGDSYALYGGHIVPQVLGGWSHELLDTTNTVDASFANVAGTPFSISGPAAERSQFVGSGSISYVANSWALGVSFDEAFQNDAHVQSARLTLSGRF